ncbi:Ras GTPase-activating-like protein iqgap1 [Chamberlinius hualienensis]
MDEDGIHLSQFGANSERVSADQMDEKRQQDVAYKYLCHLEEAKLWIESCIREALPPTTELEESLRNGVYLAKLGNYFSPKAVPLKKLYDLNQTRYKTKGLHFRHTDNINYWIKAMTQIGLPKMIFPETTDVYEKKNMPKVIYCLHALSLYLSIAGKAPKIQDLYGKVKFSEEEISAVSNELKSSGIQMPAFSTIGGILANEVPVDEAAIHACVFSVNQAIDKKANEELLLALSNPSISILDVDLSNIPNYLEELFDSKALKASQNKCNTNESRPRDAYDELLTKDEIQASVFAINYRNAFQKIKMSLQEEDGNKLLQALSTTCLGFSDVLSQNSEFYMDEFQKFSYDQVNNNCLSLEQKDDLQEAICQANIKADLKIKKLNQIKSVNKAIEINDEEQLINCLKHVFELHSSSDVASSLYMHELSVFRDGVDRDLTRDEITECINVATALAELNFCVDSEDADTTYEALLHQKLGIIDVDRECKHNYLTALVEIKKLKLNYSSLSVADVQDCVKLVNELAQEEHERIVAIQRTNEALKQDNAFVTFSQLCQPILRINNLDQENAKLYHYMLKFGLVKKAYLTDDEDVELWLDEIHTVVKQANYLDERALQCCKMLSTIYNSVVEDNLNLFRNSISNSDAGFTSVIETCMKDYYDSVKQIISNNEVNDELRTLVLYKENDELAYFYDLRANKGKWKLYEFGVESLVCLTKDMVQNVISEVTAAYDHEVLKSAMEPKIVGIQAYIRGCNARRTYFERLYYLQSQEAHVLKIQAWWRGCKQRKKYLEWQNYWRTNLKHVIKVQSFVKMHLTREKYVNRLTFFKNNVQSIIKIQTCWRANKTRKAFKELMTSTKPSFQTVQTFLHLLDCKNSDFSEELSFHQMQSEIVRMIRNNQQLEQDLATMDIKIGLLVKNRITLQDVIAHGKKLNKKSREDIETNFTSGSQGCRPFNKETQQKINAYQHLFYLLQSEPRYLSNLLFLTLSIKTTKFLESAIVSIFNYASNQREEYLLLKLFSYALREEIRLKVDKPNDIITGNSLVIKMIVGFNRNQRGQGALRDLLGPLVKQVIEDKTLKINTNPIEVYKQWVNQIETESGQLSGLAYNVDQDEALKHTEVVNQLEASIESLKTVTLLFFNAILGSLSKIPYGILYMAKVLKSSLEEKFPEASHKEILKVVGNFLYYRYINPAVVSPDAFNIIDIGGGESLSLEQRRNLASVAKILQFAASMNGFGADSPHLLSLNSFIIDCHKQFKTFFENACEVEELKTHFKIDEYTELTMLTKPAIYISYKEVCDMHILLLDQENVIAPEVDDPLHEHLEDLGEKPDVDAISESPDICLTLSSKFKMEESKRNEINETLVVTKQMIVDVMRCIYTCSIPDMLNQVVDDSMILRFNQIRESNEKNQSLVYGKEEFLNRSLTFDGSTLEETMKMTLNNLQFLESESCVSSKDNYQELLNIIAMDIRNRHQYRRRRRQDLIHMKTTLNNLKEKNAFFEDQVNYYHLYIKQCLKNMKPGKKMKMSKKLKTMRTLKYTGAKLHEKGIITDIDGLTKNQFKNVLFEISPTDTDGSFAVKVKYMGTNMADVKLDIQSLLEYQYDGVSVMKMFDRAQINVNLLLFLFNTKFYGHKK